MWWGAWISIYSDTDFIEISIEKKNNEWKYDIPDVELDSFNMEWYDDWLSNIKWTMLKSDIKFYIDGIILDGFLDKYTKYIRENNDPDDNIKFINIDVSYEITLNDMYWAWYIRWRAEDISSFDCDIEFKTAYVNFEVNWKNDYIEIDYDDYGIFEDVLEAWYVKADESEFNNMYNSIFQLPETPSDDDIKEYREMNDLWENISDDDIIERMTEQNYDWIRDEYTV